MKKEELNNENKKADRRAWQVKNNKMSDRRGLASDGGDRRGWHKNTMLAVDVKTLLRSDGVMRPGREYQGVLRRDVQVDEFRWDEHLTFTETLPWTTRRNPRVFNGRYISITRRSDGSLRPNFKPMSTSRDFNLERYAFGVYLELHQALVGLVEK